MRVLYFAQPELLELAGYVASKSVVSRGPVRTGGKLRSEEPSRLALSDESVENCELSAACGIL